MHRTPHLMAGLVGLAVLVSGCGDVPSTPPTHRGASPPNTDSGGPAEPFSTPTTAVSPVTLHVEPRFRGSASAELSEINHKVQMYLLDHPTVFSGAYYSEDLSILAIGVAAPDDPAAVGLETLLRNEDPAGTLTESVPVDYSWAELDTAKMEIVQDYMMSGAADVVSVGLDISVNAVLVTVFREAADVPLIENQTAIEIAQQYGPMVQFGESPSRAAFSGS
ncbi:hypothetical protein [Arthrobacter sp. TMN-50]